MNKPLIVLGDIPAEDLKLVAEVAGYQDLELLRQPEDTPGSDQDPIALPTGYLSFLPCTSESLLAFFSRTLVGDAQDIPFYQRIDGNSIPEFIERMPVLGVFRSPLNRLEAWNMVSAMVRADGTIRQTRELLGEAVKYRWERGKLISMGTALSSVNDLDQLLRLILSESRDAVGADAGSVYVREQAGPSGTMTNRILFKVAQNDSVSVEEKAKEIPIPINQRTISGYVAFTGKVLNIEDVYSVGDDVPFSWQKGFDRRFGYRMKSMLTVPLKNLDGEVVGVLQLMNKKRNMKAVLSTPEAVEEQVVEFSHADEELVQSIASLAAVSIERVQLHQSIQDIFEGYLGSSTAAIDERDRVTSGHSKRVAGYAMAFIDALNREEEGVFGGLRFSESRRRQFKFAALLHDIGKIGVPEALLTRETKISEDAMSALYMRAEYIKLCLLGGREGLPWSGEEELDSDIALVDKANRAGFLPDEDLEALGRIRNKYYFGPNGEKTPFLDDREWEFLSIQRGNLTASERVTINSHAQATRRILSKIPWTRELKEIPVIACHHHEKLDGSGYPDGLGEGEISFESRILAAIDIYEALVSQDRPYKRRMTPEKAIGILRAEVKAGHLDKDIVDFFVDKRVCDQYSDEGE